MRLFIFAILILFYSTDSFAQEATRSNKDAYESYQKGQRLYQQGSFLDAKAFFEQATRQTQTFQGIYYVWIGASAEKAYRSAPENLKVEKRFLLKEASQAFQTAYEKNRDPGLQYDSGKLLTDYALESAQIVIDGDLFEALQAESQIGETDSGEGLHDTSPQSEKAVTDSLTQLWKTTSIGLQTVWDAILARQHKERFYQTNRVVSDTLYAYLNTYASQIIRFMELASKNQFKGIEPNVFIPKIIAACERGEKLTGSGTFRNIREAILFDGGVNMPVAIHRIAALKQTPGVGTRERIRHLEKAISYARSDTSVASLYTVMASIAYEDIDLPTAFGYAKKAFEKNPASERVKETYGGFALSLANGFFQQGNFDQAISYILPATQFTWVDQTEALGTLYEVYLSSSEPNALLKAHKAIHRAYQLQPDNYWKKYQEALERLGRFEQARLIASKHRS